MATTLIKNRTILAIDINSGEKHTFDSVAECSRSLKLSKYQVKEKSKSGGIVKSWQLFTLIEKVENDDSHTLPITINHKHMVLRDYELRNALLILGYDKERKDILQRYHNTTIAKNKYIATRNWLASLACLNPNKLSEKDKAQINTAMEAIIGNWCGFLVDIYYDDRIMMMSFPPTMNERTRKLLEKSISKDNGSYIVWEKGKSPFLGKVLKKKYD